ncbi:MAG: polysaccharide biosynthesis tyrosine autokinase [Spirochaetaceae bacterium]|nr:polysaccharide biosynthesis tyrosine autokinase [Spirochaetaceae bacterium]
MNEHTAQRSLPAAARETEQPAPPHAEDDLSLGQIFAILIEHRWMIIFFLIIAISAGRFYIWLEPTVYRAEAVLMVDEMQENVLGMDGMSGLLTGNTTSAAEMEMIRSLRVAREVVQELELDLSVRPNFAPFVGEAVARNYSPGPDKPADAPAPAPFGLEHYAWGGERIEAGRFDIPEEMRGRPFTIVAGEDGAYRLFDDDEQPLLDGQVGQSARAELEQGEVIRIYLRHLLARPGTEFRISRSPVLRAANALRACLEVSEKGDHTGILQISLEGEDPDRLRDVVNAVANAYVRRNVEQKSEEAERSLYFIQQQLPVVKQDMEAAEAQLNEYRNRQNSVDVSGETKLMLDKVVRVETSIAELERRKKELQQSYTDRHPRIMSVDAVLSELQEQLTGINRDIQKLPNTQQDILRMERSTNVNTELYTYLLNRAQELRVAKAGMVSNVHVVDHAYRPYRPVSPKTTRIMVLSILLGLFAGGGLAFLRSLRVGVEDPERIERELGVPVFATVPYSPREQRLSRLYEQVKGSPGGRGLRRIWRLLRGKSSRLSPRRNFGMAKDTVSDGAKVRGLHSRLLAEESPEDLAVESLRSLRTGLHFLMQGAEAPVLMITGSAPQVGKSFVTANLGALIADAGARVLVVDADLRKGALHHYFGQSRRPGLGDLLTDACGREEAFRRGLPWEMDFVPAGLRLKNPAEQLMDPSFGDFVRNAAREYDIVIIDTPPVLIVTDSSIVGRLAHMSLLVVKNRAHPMRELEETAKRLHQSGVDLRGVIFNQMKVSAGRYGYGRYYGYGSYYAYGEKSEEKAD